MSAIRSAPGRDAISSTPLRTWVVTHQVRAFFVLTFAVSWSLWLLAWLSGDGPVRIALFPVGDSDR